MVLSLSHTLCTLSHAPLYYLSLTHTRSLSHSNTHSSLSLSLSFYHEISELQCSRIYICRRVGIMLEKVWERVKVRERDILFSHSYLSLPSLSLLLCLTHSLSLSHSHTLFSIAWLDITTWHRLCMYI